MSRAITITRPPAVISRISSFRTLVIGVIETDSWATPQAPLPAAHGKADHKLIAAVTW